MFVCPPIPLQPLDDGADRKFAHSERFALAMISAPAARSRWTMNASGGVLPASAHDPAVVGGAVASRLLLTMTGRPRRGRWLPWRRAAATLRAAASALLLTAMTA